MSKKRQFISNQGEVTMVQVRGGPCDGTKVLHPAPGDEQSKHGIALPLPDMQRSADRFVSAIYMWNPSTQTYGWVDYYESASVEETLTAMKAMCK